MCINQQPGQTELAQHRLLGLYVHSNAERQADGPVQKQEPPDRSHAPAWERQLWTLRRPDTKFKEELMGRSRYVITEPDRPHFLTCTVMEWLPLFSRPALVEIVLDCWRYQQKHQGLQLYGYVVMENHLHYLAQADDLCRCVASFKSFTARKAIEHLHSIGATKALERLRVAKRMHKHDREYQFWQEGSHAELVCSEAVMHQKLEYIHYNPVRRGYVDLAEHWRYSSARNYAGAPGLLKIARWA